MNVMSLHKWIFRGDQIHKSISDIHTYSNTPYIPNYRGETPFWDTYIRNTAFTDILIHKSE